MKQPTATRSLQRGQVLPLFAILITALIGLTGLVIDGSSTFVQRRDQQNAADLAAMAGGYGYLNSTGAEAAARAVATARGFTDGVDGTTVAVSVAGEMGGTTVKVSITKPHRNFFTGIFGMSLWDVGTTAKSLSGVPNAVGGAMPIIFNEDVCPGNVCPTVGQAYDEPGSGSEDIPLGAFQFNWTVFCLANGNPCNANTNLVSGLINGSSPTSPVFIDLGTMIGPLNAGAHTSLFSDLARFVGQSFPVAIVDINGDLQGFAMFHLTASNGGSTKQIEGYFETSITHQSLLIGPGSDTPEFYGLYSIRLVD
jgi:hypothetical protein